MPRGGFPQSTTDVLTLLRLFEKAGRKMAKERKSKARQKFEHVLREFEEGKLRSSTGQKVTSRKQALAIAFSEARKIDPNFGKKSALARS